MCHQLCKYINNIVDGNLNNTTECEFSLQSDINYLYCIFFPYHYNQHFLSIEYLLHSASYVSLIVYFFVECTACTTFIKKIGKVVNNTYLSDDHIIYIFIEYYIVKI